MSWSPEDLKQLRGRMGWSQAEMARCMNLELKTVAAWELGHLRPESKCHSQLSMILNQAESNADRVLRRPIAEVMMRDQNLSQIHDLELQNFVPAKKQITEN